MGYNWAKMKMKKSLRLLFLAALAVMVCFSSCTKNPEKLIVGKWKVESVRCSDDEFGEYFEEDKGETWRFDESGTFKGYLSLLEGDVECDYICDDYSLEMSGGDLTMYDDDEKITLSFDFDIDEISKKEMSLSGKCKITYKDYYEGETYTYTISGIKYELEKK